MKSRSQKNDDKNPEQKSKKIRKNSQNNSQKTSSDTKIIRKSFIWREGNRVEKVCFVFANLFLITAIFFLCLEFMKNDAWIFVCFDFAIGIASIFNAIAIHRATKKIALVMLPFGVIFIIFGISQLLGIF